MAGLKGGSIVTVGNGTTVIDRIQTAGPGTVNIPTEKINELGNYKSVATVRDVPDLTFTYESLDVSTECEAFLTGQATEGDGYDLSVSRPVDIASQFKAGKDAAAPFNVVASVAVPFLYLEQMSYKFGLRENASQSGTLRGDTIFYNPGSTYVESTAGTGVAGQTIVTAHPAYQSAEGDQRRVLAVTVGSKRLTLGADYTETYGAVTAGAAVTTVTVTDAVAVDENVRIIYASPDVATYPQTVHEGVAVKPAAVKGRDIEIYLGGYDPADRAGSQVNRAGGIQSVTVDWRVTLEKDEELGNYYAVAQDFEVPAVTGSIDFKPVDAADLMTRLRELANVTDATKVIGTSTSTPIPLDVVITNPDTHVPVKRLHVPDARFTIPGFTGRVLTKTTFSIPFESDEGQLLVLSA